MKDKNIIWLVIAGLVIFLFVYRKPIKQAAKIVEYMTRGYKNKNPGNISLTYNNDGTKRFWTGEVDGTDKRFKTFKSMAYGYRALFALLKEYISKGYNTIETIISRYAPSNENNTKAYIATVVKRTGLPANVKIAASDMISLTKLVSAISFVENGLPANEIEINEGKMLL